MTSNRQSLGAALGQALETMRGPVVFAPGEVEADAAALQRRLAEARQEMDEEDLAAFFESGAPLGRAVQQRLFTDPSLRARFQALKRQHAAELPRAPGQAAPRFAEIPAQIAAAETPRRAFVRSFPGGELEVSEVGIEQQVYLVIRFAGASIAARALMIEPAGGLPPLRIDLPPPDGSEFVLVRDLALAADAELIDRLRDPATAAIFLR